MYSGRYCDLTAESRSSGKIDLTIATQQHGKHGSVARNKHTTVEETLEVMFYVWSMPRIYNKDQPDRHIPGPMRLILH
jgi:hypothetical protein